MLDAIETGRKQRKKDREGKTLKESFPERLRFAPKSPPSTIGTRIRSALESADHYTNASGATRRFIAALNRPHKLTPDEITDRLADELSRPINTHAKRFVPVNRDWLAEIVTAAIADDAAERPVKQSAKVPSVSDVGTRIKEAIETEANYRMTCGSCIKFLQSLNETTEHDVNSIVTRLLTEIQIPTEFRKSIGDIEHQGYWLQGIVKRIIEGASHTES